MKRTISLILSLLFFLPLGAQDIHLPKNVFGALKARSIGPATMSGRVTSVDAVDCNPNIISI